jgi:hypothetical protein
MMNDELMMNAMVAKSSSSRSYGCQMLMRSRSLHQTDHPCALQWLLAPMQQMASSDRSASMALMTVSGTNAFSLRAPAKLVC